MFCSKHKKATLKYKNIKVSEAINLINSPNVTKKVHPSIYFLTLYECDNVIDVDILTTENKYVTTLKIANTGINTATYSTYNRKDVKVGQTMEVEDVSEGMHVTLKDIHFRDNPINN